MELVAGSLGNDELKISFKDCLFFSMLSYFRNQRAFRLRFCLHIGKRRTVTEAPKVNCITKQILLS